MFVACCLLTLASLGIEAISSEELVIYPKDTKGTAQKQLLQFIAQAQKSIDMVAYKVQDPKIARALADKAKLGVVVRIIIGTNQFQHEFNKVEQDPSLEILIASGIAIHERPTNLKAKYTNGHLHAHYVIIDGKKLFLTTGNFDQTTFDHCRDFGIVLIRNDETEDKFQLLQSIFEGDWNNEPLSLPVTQASVILGPEGQREQIEEFLNSAKKSLQIYQQYCNDPDIVNQLIALQQKGVKIQLLMMPCPTGYDIEDPNQATQDQLNKAGIEVKLVNVDDGIYMHARSIIRDGGDALIGTTSLSPLSLDKNRELSFIIHGKIVQSMKQQFTKDWDQALNLENGRLKAKEKRVDWNQLFSQESRE